MKKPIALIAAVSLLLLLLPAKSEENLVRDSLLEFLSKLSNNKSIPAPAPGWNSTSDPCSDNWRGVTCQSQHVRAIDLEGLHLQGVFDPATLCNDPSLSQSLATLNLAANALQSRNLAAIANCSALTQLHLSNNLFNDSVIPILPNLQNLDLSANSFSGPLPDLPRFQALISFLGQNNNFSGEIPELDYSRFQQFNLSGNNLSGQIPPGAVGLPLSSFLDNPELCGAPLPNKCPMADSESAPNAPPPPPPPQKNHKGGITDHQIVIYIGYVVIAFFVVLLILIWVRKKSKRGKESQSQEGNMGGGDGSMMKPSFSTVELKAGGLSAESGQMSTSLVVLTSPEVNGMRFEDLLKAPAELLGRGSHGSVYKVVYEEGGNGMALAVKRIKDWQISSGEFRQRMRRLNQVKHPHVMPAVAYYSSGQEKLIVYEYQQNGSLFRQIHANGN